MGTLHIHALIDYPIKISKSTLIFKKYCLQLFQNYKIHRTGIGLEGQRLEYNVLDSSFDSRGGVIEMNLTNTCRINIQNSVNSIVSK